MLPVGLISEHSSRKQTYRASLEIYVLGTDYWLYDPLQLVCNDEISKYDVTIARKTYAAKILSPDLFSVTSSAKTHFSLCVFKGRSSKLEGRQNQRPDNI